MSAEEEDRGPRLLLIAVVVITVLGMPCLCTAGLVVFAATSVTTMAGGVEEMEAQCSRAGDNAAQADVAASDGTTRLPVKGKFRYSSPFGNRMHPIERVMKPHNGIDLVTVPSGGDIVAFQDGKVSKVVHGDAGAGNYIELAHGSGVSSRYLHLDSTSVKKGKKVKAGTKIGVEGTTGGSTGNHLHFEILEDGEATNPVPYLADQGVSLPRLNGQGDASDSGSKGKSKKASSSGGSEPKKKGKEAKDQPAPGKYDSSGGAQSIEDDPAPGKKRSSYASPSSKSKPKSKSKGKVEANGRVGKWGPQQVAVAKQIIDRGEKRGHDDWMITVAVMTAMAESSLTNINHGDAARNDTIGVFQEGPERGPRAKRMNPPDAADLFWEFMIDNVPNYRDLSPTIAAHKTQGNADPWHYQPHWNDAVRMVSAIKGDPDLVAKYAGSGGSSDCEGEGEDDSVPAMAGGKDLPDPPGMKCPASGKPAEKGLQPTAKKGLQCTAKAFPKVKTIHGVGERAGGPDDHAEGLAVDFMIDDYRSKEGRALGWRIAEWNRQNADKLGVQYVIFDQKIWNKDRDDEGWRPMEDRGSDTENHLDHPHVSFVANRQK